MAVRANKVKEMGKKGLLPFSFMNKEFLHTKDGRAIRILAEFLEPEYRLRKAGIDDTIVFFGSARILSREAAEAGLRKAKKEAKAGKGKPGKPGKAGEAAQAALKKAERDLAMSRYYEDAVELSRRLTEWNKTQKEEYAICSGGGPGIMEAANKGAMLAKGPSIGLNIHLPFEQKSNPFIDPPLNFEFHYFFVRKFWFVYMAKAIIIFPGGFGTMDEMMEVLTLVQTERITKKMVIVLYGHEFWTRLLNLPYLAEMGMISPGDVDLFKVVDTVEEAFAHVTGHLTLNSRSRPSSRKP